MEKTLPTLNRKELRSVWSDLSTEEQVGSFKKLSAVEAGRFFADLDAREQAKIILTLPMKERLVWLRALEPDDVADLVQETEEKDREALLAMLDATTRNEVIALLKYAEDVAGGLMNPRYVAVKPEMRVDEAISYIRRRAREQVETIYYIYVLDNEQRLVGIASMRDLFQATAEQKVQDVMRTQLVTVSENLDQEEISNLFSEHSLMALPVLDDQGRMKGVVTVNDIVEVVKEEATEDIQKIGGTEALDAPYLESTLAVMIRKRAGWLTILFLGEMLTASALQIYQNEISKAVVLALFLPLIISAGGNAGSQASTLVIRAMALGEVRLRDVLKVMQREVVIGFALGCILALAGFLRVVLWETAFKTYGEYYFLLSLTVAASVVGVVMWGTLVGSALPFALRRIGMDPASASAPLVATLADVTGLVIYFSVASAILHGTLL
jgi:magnesium transporter